MKPETDVGQEPEWDHPGGNAAGNNKHENNFAVFLRVNQS